MNGNIPYEKQRINLVALDIWREKKYIEAAILENWIAIKF